MQPVTVLLTALQLLFLVLPGEPQGLEEKLDSSNVNCSHIQPVHECAYGHALQLVRSVSSSVDKGGTCHCVVHLPNNPIPLQQLEQLHSTAQELICKYEQELSRAQVSECARAVEDQDNEVLEMNHTLESRNPSALASPYENPAFNLLRLELEGAQELVTQLKDKGGISVAGDLLYDSRARLRQVTNANLTLKLLADSDQHSFGALQKEVDVLESQLSECERDKEKEQASRYPGPPLAPASSAHGDL
ncbi:Olfactomedin-4 [Plecturocebus cupreus]